MATVPLLWFLRELPALPHLPQSLGSPPACGTLGPGHFAANYQREASRYSSPPEVVAVVTRSAKNQTWWVFTSVGRRFL